MEKRKCLVLIMAVAIAIALIIITIAVTTAAGRVISIGFRYLVLYLSLR